MPKPTTTLVIKVPAGIGAYIENQARQRGVSSKVLASQLVTEFVIRHASAVDAAEQEADAEVVTTE